MEKSSGTLAAFTLVLFLFCYLQAPPAAMAQRECLFPDVTRSETAQEIVDLAGSECSQGPGSVWSGCCKMINEFFNITCACSPDSGLTVPENILTSAKALCGVSIPQLGHCQGYCGSNITHIQEALRLHEQCRKSPMMMSRYCCSGLEQELDLNCMCSSTAASQMVIPSALVSAVSRCNISVPQTGPCYGDPTSAKTPVVATTVVEDPASNDQVSVSVATDRVEIDGTIF